MKKLTYSILAAATLLFAACARETQPAATDGQLADVTFQIGLDQVQTKAFSDGKTATDLDVMVFSANSATPVYLQKLTQNLTGAFNNQLKANVAMKLVKGETYKIAFWAHAPQCPYTLDPATATITAATSAAANNEAGDAFFGVFEGKVTASLSESVTLKRPFAQVNILTREADWTAAVTNNGIAFNGSSMALTAPTKLNLLTGAVSEEKAIAFNKAAITEAVNIAGYTTGYKYIAMNYVLAPEANVLLGETNKPFSFSVYREGQEDALFTTPMQNVPVRRNYRTVIAGDVFCVDATFEVSIVSAYDGTQTPENPDQSLIQATITASDKSVEVGETVSLGATTNSTSALTYESLTPAVATVDANGVVTGVEEGTASIKISVAANDAYTAASKTITVTVTAEQGGGDEPPTPASITIDGDVSDWDDVTTEFTTGQTRIVSWKYAVDESNIYFLYKVAKAQIPFNEGYTWEPYIYTGFNNDNDATTGSNGGANLGDGYEARFALYPWTGDTEGSPEMYDGTRDDNKIQCPVGTTVGTPSYAGVFSGDYCYLEVSVPLNLIGNPTGTITVNHSLSWQVTGAQEITISTGGDEPGGGDEPATAGITIDGNMSDWANITGTTKEGSVYCALKAIADADYIYIYSKRTTHRFSELWPSGYFYYDFDLDNNAETGDYSEGSHGNFEAWLYITFGGGNADNPVFNTTPSGGATGASLTDIICNGALPDDGVELEVRIPRANLPAFTGNTISITSWGNKDGNLITTTCSVVQ